MRVAPLPPLAVLLLCRCVQQVASGAKHLHANGLGHGDIKPDNVLIMRSGDGGEGCVAQLADLGMTRGESLRQGLPFLCSCFINSIFPAKGDFPEVSSVQYLCSFFLKYFSFTPECRNLSCDHGLLLDYYGE